MTTNKEEHPKLAWTPSAAVIENANVTAIQRKLGLDGYKDLHRWLCCLTKWLWSTPK